MNDPSSNPPVFILGVPRSGTTLLRTILDSHPAIACGPETPWLGGHQPRSVMELWRFLREHRLGYCKSFGADPAIVDIAAREFVSRLMGEYARMKGKRRWAEKTPDNALHVDFLLHLFPDARFIHLVRDGLDVAISTSIMEKHRKGISVFLEKHLRFGPGVPPVENNPFNAILRWRHWNNLIEQSLHGREHLRVNYERLVAEPELTLREVMRFIKEPFDPRMLEYSGFPHDFPSWEWGSADVQMRGVITQDRVGRGRRILSPTQQEVLAGLAEPAGHAIPSAALASVGQIEADTYSLFMSWLNSLAGAQSLQTFTGWSKIWEYPWIWFNGLRHLHWRNVKLIDLGSALSPMPWLCALLGARVTLIESTSKFVPIWTRLRDTLRVNVEWRIVDSERIPAPDEDADVFTSFSVIEHQPDKALAIAEAVRVLKPGGLMCLSFDVCEPSEGMNFPEWNGRALTLGEFEDLVWRHPSFENTERPRWNHDDVPAFLEWHRKSALHHDYAVAAAVLCKRSL